MEVILIRELVTLVFIGLFVLKQCACAPYNASDETRLFKKLFHEHNPYIVPRDNSSVPIYVTINTYFLYLNNVDVKSQTYTARIFFELLWNDCLLRWNASRYTGVEKINVPFDWIWTPDICIAGSVTEFIDIGKRGTTVVVHSNGSIEFWPVKVFTITCVVDIRQYPFDEQNCEIDLSSWTYDDNIIRMLAGHHSIDVSMLTSSGEWDIQSGIVYTRTDPHNGLGYSHVIFPFKIRRRWQFVILTTFFPTLCTSLLTLLCFCLPKESGEKVGLSISIFLTLAVFMTVTSQDLPETADGVSLLGAYVALQLGWSGTTIVFTVISLVIAFQSDKEHVPRWLQKLAKIRTKRHQMFASNEHVPDPLRTPVETKNENDLNIEGEAKCVTSGILNYSNVSWDQVATFFNTLCLLLSISWQLFLNFWFLFRSFQ